MAAYKKTHTTTAQEVLILIFASIGKPFYFVLSHVFIGIIFVLFLVGRSFQKIFSLKITKKIKSKKTKTESRIINLNLQINNIFKKIESSIKSIKNFLIKRPDITKIKGIVVNLKINWLRFDLKILKTFPKVKLNIRHIFLILLTIIFFTVSYNLIFKDLPSPRDLINREQEVSTKIYDRNGVLLYTIYKNKNRTLVNLSDVPEVVRNATLAAEDAEFYSHPGFSIRGMIRAIGKNISDGRLEGGSTITQQLVKNALLSSEKTYIRKIRELILSIGVEMNFSKDQILEMYLNEVNYGGNVYGIEEASWHYFGKSAKNLDLPEAALLAGLPQSPTKYSPFGSNPELTFSRQREVLHLMKINKFISSSDEETAKNSPILFAPNRQEIRAPHFVMYVKEKLIDQFGEETVLKGGLEVTTTLDINIQEIAEKYTKEEIDKLKGLNVGNSAVIITDPKDGSILAMVGSKDYFDINHSGNVNVTTSLRQPGSSIKVINYAEALSNGLTLSSVVDDSPITFNVQGQKPYSPKNYDNKFKGKITIRSALAESRNIPAVKVLASYGVNKMIDLAEKMGITTWKDRSRYGLSLTLGGGETKLIEMAEVYSVLANQGIKNEIKYIKEIKNHKGKIINQAGRFANNKNQVLDPRIAFLITSVLSDNSARSPAFGASSMLNIPNHPEVAVKTGTSNDLKDNLTIGYNQDYVVAVWVGNNDGSPMGRVASGITGAAPIWNKIMRSLLIDKSAQNWTVPNGIVKKECFKKEEWYLEEKQMSCPKIVEPSASTDSNQVLVN